MPDDGNVNRAANVPFGAAGVMVAASVSERMAGSLADYLAAGDLGTSWRSAAVAEPSRRNRMSRTAAVTM